MKIQTIGYVIGFVAQIFFSIRLLVQWIQSEKLKKVLTPTSFWIFSLFGAFLMFVYGWIREDFAIILGQSLTYFIYIRNLQLQNAWEQFHKVLRFVFLIFPIGIVIYFFNNNQMDLAKLFQNENIPTGLLIWGSLGQIIFMFRFVYQWIYSERKKESSLPLGFWLISLVGSFMILSYAVIRKDPVLFIGQSFGFVVYIRNIIIGQKSKTLAKNEE